jgi:hypothetical protein
MGVTLSIEGICASPPSSLAACGSNAFGAWKSRSLRARIEGRADCSSGAKRGGSGGAGRRWCWWGATRVDDPGRRSVRLRDQWEPSDPDPSGLNDYDAALDEVVFDHREVGEQYLCLMHGSSLRPVAKQHDRG